MEGGRVRVCVCVWGGGGLKVGRMGPMGGGEEGETGPMAVQEWQGGRGTATSFPFASPSLHWVYL